MIYRWKFLFAIVSALLFSAAYFSFANPVFAASLSIEPAAGTFVVGSTFNASIFLDTENELVNAVEAYLSFPPDKLQVVSPSVGFSVINSWIRQPSYDNLLGRISLQGAIPSGIYADKGLITTVTFRVKSPGRALVKFLDGTSVLLADGKATNALKDTRNGLFDLVLPPPAGPLVVSDTHPDQNKWYPQSTVSLRWAEEEGVERYSFILNEKPVDIPDDIAEGGRGSVIYKNLPDGTHYFHIKAFRGGGWGGTSHFAINIDTEPPSEFKINVTPSPRTVRRQPILDFGTTDNLSGLDHFELKLIPLTPKAAAAAAAAGVLSGGQPLFIEVKPPYIPPSLEIGDYDVIVRAYDKAGNFREVKERLKIRQALLEFFGEEGIILSSRVTIPWFYVFLGGLLLAGALFYIAIILRRWHRDHDLRTAAGRLPDHVRSQLEELKRYRQKYGKHLILLIGIISFIGVASATSAARAQTAGIAPPIITTISKDISNEEIFYVGGKTDVAGAEVIIYLQNLQTGETLSQTVTADKRGDWFYRHGNFLSVGNFLIWTQSKVGDELSPPSPQIQMTVRQTAIQFGASRLSYETLYLIFTIILLIAVLGLGLYVIYHAIHARRKHAKFLKEVREAEESLRRGFAILKRDIEAELALIRKAKFDKSLLAEEKAREAQLLKDLEEVQKYIGKEIWDIEDIGREIE